MTVCWTHAGTSLSAAGTGLSMGQAEEEGYRATAAQEGEERVAGRGWLRAGLGVDRAGGRVYRSAVLSAD